MFLTPSAGGTNLPRFAITTSGNGNEQRINSSIAIPANTWTHVAVTLSGNTATLYINGVVAGTNANMTLKPASLGSTTQNYVGKSQFSGDPAMQGEVDDFRIYSRALSQAEVQSLAAINPAAYWKFDETEGTTAADSSGNGHTATLGTGTSHVAGVVGARAASFNGTSASVATVTGPVVNTAASFTVSAWVLPNSTSGYQTFVSNCGATIAGYFLQLRGDTGTFAFTVPDADSDNSVTIADSGVQPVVGQWYQLTGVANASANTISIYVNGVLENTASFSDWWSATGNTLIGHGFYNGAATDYVNGSVDNVQIFPVALSATQVLGLHEAAAFSFNEGSGTTTADATGHGNTLTLGSGVSWTTGRLGANALAFNGTSNATAAFATPVLNTAMPLSVSAWVYLNSASTTQTFASIEGGERPRVFPAIPQRHRPVRLHPPVGRQRNCPVLFGAIHERSEHGCLVQPDRRGRSGERSSPALRQWRSAGDAGLHRFVAGHRGDGTRRRRVQRFAGRYRQRRSGRRSLLRRGDQRQRGLCHRHGGSVHAERRYDDHGNHHLQQPFRRLHGGH